MRAFWGLAGLIFGAAFVYGFFRLIGFADQFWPYSSLVLSAFVYFPFTLNLILLPFRSKLWREAYYLSMTHWLEVPTGIITLTAMHAVAFANLCSWLQACPPAICVQPAFEGLRTDATTAVFLLLVAKDGFELLTLGVLSALDFNPLGELGITVEPSSQFAKALNLSYSLALGMGLVSFLMRYYRESVLRRTDWQARIEPIWKWESQNAVLEARDSALRKIIDTLGDDIHLEAKRILRAGDLETVRQIEHIATSLERVPSNDAIYKYAQEHLHAIRSSQEEAASQVQTALNDQLTQLATALDARIHEIIYGREDR